MTIRSFINELKDALNGELPVNEIRNHIDYYENYLIVKAKNMSEEEAVASLGSPNLIAKTLINDYRMTHPTELHYTETGFGKAAEHSEGTFTSNDEYNAANNEQYTSGEDKYTDSSFNGKYKSFNLNSKTFKILKILLPILFLIIVFFIGRFLFKFIIPIIIICFFVYIIGGIFGRK